MHEYDEHEHGSDAMSDGVAEKLQRFQSGKMHSQRMRKISYVQSGANRSRGGGGGPGRIADLVVLNEYDDDGNLARKGTCIVKGVQRNFAKINPAQNPMTKNKDGSSKKVEMQFQIVEDGKDAKERSGRPWSASSAARPKVPLALDPDEIPQPSEFANKPMVIHEPPTRTRSEARSWIQTHADVNSHLVQCSALSVKSMQSINFAVAASLHHIQAYANTSSATVDLELASKANSAFKQRGSFTDRENMRMSQRRSLARQPPARQRVRYKPTIGAAHAREVPHANLTTVSSPSCSPQAGARVNNTGQHQHHVRFEASDLIRLESRLSDVHDDYVGAHMPGP